MNPNPHTPDQDPNAELDRLLLTHLGSSLNAPAHLIPSSGFTHSVMDAIHQQTTAPPPIPFPWKRLIPAAIALAFSLLAFAWLATSPSAAALLQSIPSSPSLSRNTIQTITLIASTIALSIATTAIAFKLSTRR